MIHPNAAALAAAAIMTSLYLPVQAAGTDGQQQLQSKDVIVTATKTKEEVRAVPQAVEVWTQEDLQRMGASDVVSALQLANNVKPA